MKRRTKLNTWENTQNNSWDRSKTQLPEEIKAINRAVIAASRKLASEMDHYSQESMAEEWNWLGDLRQRAYELDDFQTNDGDRFILRYAMEEDINDIEVKDDQTVVEQFEFVRSISKYVTSTYCCGLSQNPFWKYISCAPSWCPHRLLILLEKPFL